MDNESLKTKYDEMHSQGPSAWYGDGNEERELILKMGEPWEGKNALEVGCGEGDLCKMIWDKNCNIVGIDYSSEAIEKAYQKYPSLPFECLDYRDEPDTHDIIVMQGVLEHLDKPFEELQWMIDHFKPKTVITSSPCFLNPRGIIWMTLHMLGAVMSKTDLHFLHPWEFEDFCDKNNYDFRYDECDFGWGHSEQMIDDLKKRIPLALKDGGIKFDRGNFDDFIYWLEKKCDYDEYSDFGATVAYRINIS